MAAVKPMSFSTLTVAGLEMLQKGPAVKEAFSSSSISVVKSPTCQGELRTKERAPSRHRLRTRRLN